jgi:hypothetical protein
MQAPVRFDYIKARTQPQMKRVAEDDLRPALFKICRRQSFHRSICADRHEDRSLDYSVGELHPTAPRATIAR